MRWSLSALLLLACEGPGPEPVEVPTDTAVCTALTWDNFAEGYLRSWCTGCHHTELESGQRYGAPVGVDFDTLELTLAQGDRVLDRATGEAPTMPPVGGSDEEGRARLVEWLACQGIE